MKQLLVLSLLFAFLLVLSSCKAPEPIIIDRPAEVICPDKYMRIGTTCCLDADDSKICDADEKIVSVVVPVVPAKPAEPLPAAVPTINKIYEKAKKQIENGYTFSVMEEQFFVNGNHIRLLPSDYINLGYDYANARLNLVDTVYFDVADKTAFGTCSGRFFKSSVNARVCVQDGKTYPLYYNDYYYKSPIDWLVQYQGKTEMYYRELDKEIRGYYTDIIMFDDGATTTSIWVDHGSGIPLRINVERKKDKWTQDYYEYGGLRFYIEPEEVAYQG